MKCTLPGTLLALAFLSTLAAEENQLAFYVTDAHLHPNTPFNTAEYAVDEDDNEEAPPTAMRLVLSASIGNMFTSDESLYSVSETESWNDWESGPGIITHVRFEGVLTDANGNNITLDDISLKQSDKLLQMEIASEALPDTMKLQLRGTLSFDLWYDTKGKPTEPIQLNFSKKDSETIVIHGIQISAFASEPDEEEEVEEDEAYDEEEEEEEDDFISYSSKDSYQLSFIAEKEEELTRLSGITLITGEEEEYHDCDELEKLPSLNGLGLQVREKEFALRLHLRQNPQPHQFKLDQAIYLNGKK